MPRSCCLSLLETPETEESVTMKCHFLKGEMSWANLLLAGLGIREKLLQGFPKKLWFLTDVYTE